MQKHLLHHAVKNPRIDIAAAIHPKIIIRKKAASAIYLTSSLSLLNMETCLNLAASIMMTTPITY